MRIAAGSTRVSSAANQLRSQLSAPRPKETVIGFDLKTVFRGNNSVMVMCDAASIQLMTGTPMNSMCLKDSFGNSPVFNFYIAALRALGSTSLPADNGIIAPFIGDFLYSEHEKGGYSAHAFLMGGGVAAKLFSNRGAFRKLKGYSSAESLYASALITYEQWLQARPVSESLIEHPRLGRVHHFAFGREHDRVNEILNIRFTGRASNTRWMHTVN